MRSSICERPTCKPRYAEFSCRLAKIAQTAQNKRETGNVIFAMATLIRVKAAVRRDFFKSLLHFCKFLVNPSSISKLTTSSENQRTDTLTLYFSYGNIVNFSRTSRIHLYLKKTTQNAIQSNVRRKTPKISHSLAARGPHITHLSHGPLHSPPQMTAWSIHAISHNYATNSHLLTMGCPTFTPKTVPSSGTQIQSAVLPEYTLQTERQTDRPMG